MKQKALLRSPFLLHFHFLLFGLSINWPSDGVCDGKLGKMETINTLPISLKVRLHENDAKIPIASEPLQTSKASFIKSFLREEFTTVNSTWYIFIICFLWKKNFPFEMEKRINSHQSLSHFSQLDRFHAHHTATKLDCMKQK